MLMKAGAEMTALIETMVLIAADILPVIPQIWQLNGKRQFQIYEGFIGAELWV